MEYFWRPMPTGLSYHAARHPRRRRRTRGQALVEFAVVLPVFLLILSGILDFGFILYSRITVISAAREGARIATTMTDQPTNIITAVRSQATAAAGGLSVTVPNPVLVCGAANPGCAFSAGKLKTGDSIKVTVTYTHHAFFPLLFGAGIPMSSTVQMVLE
jgi:Flp pilus assembly protein TadG